MDNKLEIAQDDLKGNRTELIEQVESNIELDAPEINISQDES